MLLLHEGSQHGAVPQPFCWLQVLVEPAAQPLALQLPPHQETAGGSAHLLWLLLLLVVLLLRLGVALCSWQLCEGVLEA
jgi:hypothetical protein